MICLFPNRPDEIVAATSERQRGLEPVYGGDWYNYEE